MKAQIIKICKSGSLVPSSMIDPVVIKTEPVDETPEAATFYGGYNKKSYYNHRNSQQDQSYNDKVMSQTSINSNQFSRNVTQGQQVYKRGRNPLDKFGNNTRCYECDSVNHWQKDCPDLKNKVWGTYECDSSGCGQQDSPTFQELAANEGVDYKHISYEVTLHQDDCDEQSKQHNLVAGR